MLKSIIQLIQDENIHGCLLLNVLFKYVKYGSEHQVKNASEIIRSINRIFYRHLCNWIIFGRISDPCGEFFICDGVSADENFQYSKDIAVFDHGKGSESSLSDILSSVRKIRHPPMVRKFFINWEMLPIFIDKETAECILFMGRIVWIMKNEPKSDTDNYHKDSSPRDIWEGTSMDYYKKLQALETEIFNKTSFDNTIEECRIKITKYLWTVLLNEGNLVEHLHQIREYVALGRAELYQQFITVINEKNKANRTTSSKAPVLHNINTIFSECARKIYGDNNESHSKFILAVAKSDNQKSDPWSQLNIYFEVNWPLHIVFHPKVMELYNKLFSLLLRLKKSEIDLTNLWHIHLCYKKPIDSRVLMLRQKLMFLITTLQYFIQVDVIEAEFYVLLKAVENANHFEDIVKLHNQFVCSLLKKTFILTFDQSETFGCKSRVFNLPTSNYTHSKVFNLITRLLELCDHFCFAATYWEPELMEIEINQLEAFQMKADFVVESLMFILTNMHAKVSGQYLSQLLTQLDFNKYFSKNRLLC
ncbi:gamma-tubulin complex component 4-like isoform X2 [Aethina tumida]|nr:gamma-tubulin complex component 4-like isoform X2 [Aethina tumida]